MVSDRAERREDIKLRLEVAKLALSLFGLGTLIFAGLQWRASIRADEAAARAAQVANVTARQDGYQRVAGEWRAHLVAVAERPELRPYLEDRRSLALGDPHRNAVLALADLRLDTMDAILTYAALQGSSEAIGGWKRTFAAAFRNSPVLCQRLNESAAGYGLVVEIGDRACRGASR